MCSLVVWDKDVFWESHHVKTSYPSQSTFRSFERQLNFWGFKRDYKLEGVLLAYQSINTANSNATATASTIATTILTKDSLRAFYHPCFQKGRPDLLAGVRRRPSGRGNKVIKETIVRAASKIAPPIKQKKHIPSLSPSEGASPDNPKPSLKGVPKIASPATSSSSSSDREDSNHEKQLEERQLVQLQQKQEHVSSNRTDIVLPSGVCVRINQRIPAWAIPAQEAAIRYLYQKHSNMKTKMDSNNNNHRQVVEDSAAAAAASPRQLCRTKPPTAKNAPPPKEVPATNDGFDRDWENKNYCGFDSDSGNSENSSSDCNSDCDSDDDDDDDSLRSKSSRDRTTTLVVANTNNSKEKEQHSRSVFSRQNPAIDFRRFSGGTRGEDSLGSLLQSFQPRIGLRGHCSSSRRTKQSDSDDHSDDDSDSDSDIDRFGDATEDEAPTPFQTKSIEGSHWQKYHKENNVDDDDDDEKEEEGLVI